MRYRFAVPLALYSSSTYPLLARSREVAPNGIPLPLGAGANVAVVLVVIAGDPWAARWSRRNSHRG
jgi:hypothetical protein